MRKGGKPLTTEEVGVTKLFPVPQTCAWWSNSHHDRYGHRHSRWLPVWACYDCQPQYQLSQVPRLSYLKGSEVQNQIKSHLVSLSLVGVLQPYSFTGVCTEVICF